MRLRQRAEGSARERTFESALPSVPKFRETWSYSRSPTKPSPCAPELADYAYIVVEDDFVIVNPADYAIVQVISD